MYSFSLVILFKSEQKDHKLSEESKKVEGKEVEHEEQTTANNEGEKKTEGEKNEEENEKPKEKEEVVKQAPDRINIIPEAHIQNLVATHNHTLHAISKVNRNINLMN